MPQLTSLLFFLSLTMTSFGQSNLRPLDQLINTQDPALPQVQKWAAAAKNKVEILPGDSEKGKSALYKTQVTSRSPMGAIVFSTGGILVDGGWIRILGAGHSRLNRSLPDWNKGKSFKEFGDPPPYLLVADDAVGGFFAINGGGLGNDPGKVYYLSPDNLEWEALDLTYTDFLNFCFNGDLEDFYKNLRWTGWRQDVITLDGSQTYNFFPYLWTKEGKDINKVSRRAISVDEQFRFTLDMRRQLGLTKNGM